MYVHQELVAFTEHNKNSQIQDQAQHSFHYQKKT